MTDDRQLVEAYLSRRDDASFVALYRTHTPALYRMAWRMGGIAQVDIDDVVQETWLRAARGLAQFRFQSALRTWLTSILINCLQEARRRRDPLAPDDASGDVEAPRRNLPLAIDLDRAIAMLPSGMRDVLVLHDIEGFTHDEVADALGVTTGTSKSQLFDARRKLRHVLTKGES
jgi:RNA polymerase sigma factor (sigma-70 family)